MLVFKFQECEIRILQGRFTYRRSSLLQNAKLGKWTQEPLTTKGGLVPATVTGHPFYSMINIPVNQLVLVRLS